MNRRDFFRGAPRAALAGAAVAATLPKLVEATVAPTPPPAKTLPNVAPAFRMEKVAEFRTPVRAMVAYRDGVVVCTEDETFFISEDPLAGWSTR